MFYSTIIPLSFSWAQTHPPLRHYFNHITFDPTRPKDGRMNASTRTTNSILHFAQTKEGESTTLIMSLPCVYACDGICERMHWCYDELFARPDCWLIIQFYRSRLWTYGCHVIISVLNARRTCYCDGTLVIWSSKRMQIVKRNNGECLYRRARPLFSKRPLTTTHDENISIHSMCIYIYIYHTVYTKYHTRTHYSRIEIHAQKYQYI